jgi:hypothetical protein
MNKIKNRWLWQTLFAVLLLAASGAIFITANAQGNLVATLSVGNRHITVGDVIPLTLRVTHPAGWRVIFPALDEQWGDFEVRRQSTPEIVTNPDGTQTTAQEIQVARMRPGEVQTPALSLSVADDQGNLNNLEVAPVAISIRSVLVDGDTTLREIKPQAELVTERRPYWPLVSVGLLGSAALAGYGVHRWRNRKPADRRTPRQRTLDTLKALGAQNPQTLPEMKTYCAHLADCLRDYLAAIANLPARDLTTREISRHFKGQEFPPAWSAQVVDVLRVCDGVKFANQELELPAIQTLTVKVRQLVEQYPPQPQPAPRRSGRKEQVEVNA